MENIGNRKVILKSGRDQRDGRQDYQEENRNPCPSRCFADSFRQRIPSKQSQHACQKTVQREHQRKEQEVAAQLSCVSLEKCRPNAARSLGLLEHRERRGEAAKLGQGSHLGCFYCFKASLVRQTYKGNFLGHRIGRKKANKVTTPEYMSAAVGPRHRYSQRA